MKTTICATVVVVFLSISTALGQPFGRGSQGKALTAEAKEAVLTALAGPDGEYAAHALYTAILEQHGSIQPFAAIREAESRHIRALERQLKKYGVTVPKNTFEGKAKAPETILAAAQQGVESERANIAMYDRFLEAVKEYPDLTRVFTHLQRASREGHLPAFEATVKREGGSVEGSNAVPKPAGSCGGCCECCCCMNDGKGEPAKP